jgi:hypothetical protein
MSLLLLPTQIQQMVKSISRKDDSFGFHLEIEQETGMVNLTELVNSFNEFNGTEHDLDNFLREKDTLDFIEALRNALDHNVQDLSTGDIFRRIRGKKSRVMARPELALKLATRMSKPFEVWVYQVLIEVSGWIKMRLIGKIEGRAHMTKSIRDVGRDNYSEETSLVYQALDINAASLNRDEMSETELAKLSDAERFNGDLILAGLSMDERRKILQTRFSSLN